MNMDYLDLEKTGSLIAEARKEKGLTQLKLAERLNITDRAVSKWERGKAFPDVSLLKPLAAELELTVSELLDGQRKAEPITVSESEEVTIKAIRTYEKKAENKNLRNWGMTALILLLCLGVFFAARYSVRPADFQLGDYNLTSIGLAEGWDGAVRYSALNEKFDDELKTQLKAVLLNIKDPVAVQGKKAPHTNYVALEGTGYFCEDGYYDLRSKKFYYYTGSYAVYQRLWDIVCDNLQEEDYKYTRKKAWTFENPKRHLSIDCEVPDEYSEVIIQWFMDGILEEPRFEEYPDAYTSETRIKRIKRLSEKEYKSLEDFKYIQKEIGYRELHSYRIYDVTEECRYTNAKKALGPQYPDGTRHIIFLVGKNLGDSTAVYYISMPFNYK